MFSLKPEHRFVYDHNAFTITQYKWEGNSNNIKSVNTRNSETCKGAI